MAPRETTSLLWLWITLGVVGATVITVATYFIVKSYMSDEEEPELAEDLTEWDWEKGEKKQAEIKEEVIKPEEV